MRTHLGGHSVALTLLAVMLVLLACGVPASATPVASTAPAAATVVLAAEATATVPLPATPTPHPTATIVPPAPGSAPAFSDLGAAVTSYLDDSGGNVEALGAALRTWGMAPQTEGSLSALTSEASIVAADLDGDGIAEVILTVANPQPITVIGEGELLVATEKGGSYSIAYDSAAAGGGPGPTAILAVADVNADGVSDLAYGVESCGASTCFDDVRVVTYQNGAYEDLSGGIVVAYPDLIALRDESGDAKLEIVIHGGTQGSVGAGPQRATTMVYTLTGGTYQLAEERPDPSNLLYFKVLDANAALAAGRTAEAIALYSTAATDSTLKANGTMMNGMSAEQELDLLRSFARFRLVVANAIGGDEAAAQAALADAEAAGGMFSSLATAFSQSYEAGSDVQAGCAAVAGALSQMPGTMDALNSFGYANPSWTPEDVCRGTGTGGG